MKKVTAFIFYLLCDLAAGLTVGAVAWGIPAYSSLRETTAREYLDFFDTYSYVQYRQAAPEQAREALLVYLRAIGKLRNKNVRRLKQKLAFESSVTYLRFYHLAQLSNNLSEAEEDMRGAQREAASLGAGDVSAATLRKTIETREAAEIMKDSNLGILPAQSPVNGRAGEHP